MKKENRDPRMKSFGFVLLRNYARKNQKKKEEVDKKEEGYNSSEEFPIYGEELDKSDTRNMQGKTEQLKKKDVKQASTDFQNVENLSFQKTYSYKREDLQLEKKLVDPRTWKGRIMEHKKPVIAIVGKPNVGNLFPIFFFKVFF